MSKIFTMIDTAKLIFSTFILNCSIAEKSEDVTRKLMPKLLKLLLAKRLLGVAASILILKDVSGQKLLRDLGRLRLIDFSNMTNFQ